MVGNLAETETEPISIFHGGAGGEACEGCLPWESIAPADVNLSGTDDLTNSKRPQKERSRTLASLSLP
jgi:hypothetical protein